MCATMDVGAVAPSADELADAAAVAGRIMALAITMREAEDTKDAAAAATEQAEQEMRQEYVETLRLVS